MSTRFIVGIFGVTTVFCSVLTTACARKPENSEAQDLRSSSEPDSLVLERTPCFGTCPAYRLRVSNTGEVLFFATDDPTEIVRDTVAVTTLAELTTRAREIGFFALPAEISKDSVLCHKPATDHPTVTTTFFAQSQTKTVVDYHGCFETVEHGVLPRVQRLRAFENEIDSVLRSSRWVRPRLRR
jgi:hypothetical protein